LIILSRMPVTDQNKREQLEVIRLAYAPMFLLGLPEECLQIFQSGEKLSIELGDDRELAWIYTSMSGYYYYRGGFIEASTYTERSFSIAQKIQDIDLMAHLAPNIARGYFGVGNYPRVIDIVSPVIDMLEKAKREAEYFSQPFNVYSWCCVYKGNSLGLLGNFEEGIAISKKGIGNATELDDRFTLGMCEILFGFLLLLRWALKQGIEHIQNSLKYLEEVKFMMFLNFSHSLLGFAYCYLGDKVTSKKHIEQSLKIMNETGIELFKESAYMNIGMCHYESGDLTSARRFLEEAIGFAQQGTMKIFEGYSLIWLGATLGKMDSPDIETSGKHILKGISILETQRLKAFYSVGYVFLGELYATTDRVNEAHEYLEKAEALFKEMGMDYWLATTYAIYAELYNEAGDQSKAKDHLGKAIEIFKECGVDGRVEKYEKELADL